MKDKPAPTTPAIDEILHEYYNGIFEDCLEKIKQGKLLESLADAKNLQAKADAKARTQLNQFYAEEMLSSLPEKKKIAPKYPSGFDKGFNQAIDELRTAITKRFGNDNE